LAGGRGGGVGGCLVERGGETVAFGVKIDWKSLFLYLLVELLKELLKELGGNPGPGGSDAD
jgi:hypothetical protein